MHLLNQSVQTLRFELEFEAFSNTVDKFKHKCKTLQKQNYIHSRFSGIFHFIFQSSGILCE